MDKNKGDKEKGANWGKFGGGSNVMHKFQPAGTQESDHTAVTMSGGSRRDIAPKAGPSDVMGYSKNEARNSRGAGPQEPGTSAVTGARQDGFAHGGKTPMFGNRGSRPARGGCSSPE